MHTPNTIIPKLNLEKAVSETQGKDFFELHIRVSNSPELDIEVNDTTKHVTFTYDEKMRRDILTSFRHDFFSFFKSRDHYLQSYVRKDSPSEIAARNERKSSEKK